MVFARRRRRVREQTAITPGACPRLYSTRHRARSAVSRCAAKTNAEVARLVLAFAISEDHSHRLDVRFLSCGSPTFVKGRASTRTSQGVSSMRSSFRLAPFVVTGGFVILAQASCGHPYVPDGVGANTGGT